MERRIVILLEDGEPQRVWLMPADRPVADAYRALAKEARREVAKSYEELEEEGEEMEGTPAWQRIEPGQGWDELTYMFLSIEANGEVSMPYC